MRREKARLFRTFNLRSSLRDAAAIRGALSLDRTSAQRLLWRLRDGGKPSERAVAGESRMPAVLRAYGLRRGCVPHGFHVAGVHSEANRRTSGSGESARRRLCTFPGVETVALDFGIERRDVAVQCDRLPEELIRLAGTLGLGIELSHYPAASQPHGVE